MNKSEIALKVVGVIMFFAVVVGLIAMESNDCDGQLVRGLFWLECIGDK
jgi:hypothetical protein